jgi:hypothetical protein
VTNYWSLSEAEAAAALQEFLDERGPALERLHEAIRADGQDPHAVLNFTVKSLRPLWAWVKSIVTERAAGEMELAPVEAPTWLRYCAGPKPPLSRESVVIVDGLVSYVCRVVERGAPHASWRVGDSPTRFWVWQNHPVLGVGDNGWALGELVQLASHPTGGRIRSQDNMLALQVKAWIDYLARSGITSSGDEPLVEVADLGEDPLRGRELEVSLREDVASKYPRAVDRMVKNLAKEMGIAGVIREDREVLLVATSSWEAKRLEEWVSRYLTAKIRD